MNPRLRAVPDVAPRAVAYVRVSMEREEMISPELQLSAIRDHCERHGYTIVETLTDLDRTGRLWKRRQVEQAVAMIEAGTADVVVVWKLSRISRNRRDSILATDRIESVGGRLESATEPIDTTTSSGRFARGVLSELAAFESDRIGEGWRDVHAHRIAKGLPANGKPRWGYRYVGGRHEPDPETGPVLADLYTRYVAGESVYALVGWLNEHGYRTAPGYTTAGPGPWSDRSLRRMLDSGFGAGQLFTDGQHRPGAHEPVIDEQTWQAYLAARTRRRVTRSSERSEYLLSGMVRCACGSAMTGGQFGHARQPKYRCKAGHEQRRHPGGYTTMRVVETAVVDWLRSLAADVDEATDRAAAAAAHRTRRRTDVDLIRREITAVDEQLTRLTVLAADGTVPTRAYLSARDEIEQRRQGLLARERQAVVDTEAAGAPALAAALLERWPTVPVATRREGLRRLVKHVVVTPARPRSTVQIVPAWEPGERGPQSPS